MKSICFLFFFVCTSSLHAQNSFAPTDKFSIEGRVKRTLSFSLSDIDTFKTKSLPDVVITNHVGVVKKTLTQLKGILVKDILTNVEIDAENPKVLSEYYFVFVATDNYRIVFSWNEIFNTETGNNIYIITDEDGKKMKNMEERIAMICITDFKTGRRDLKNLSKIIVERTK